MDGTSNSGPIGLGLLVLRNIAMSQHQANQLYLTRIS
jgi:hypothetical protein